MAKKMKLISESEYNRYLKLSGTNDQNGRSDAKVPYQKLEKNEILESNSIPDDIKLILYQDMARRMYQKKHVESKKPFLVETIASKKEIGDQSILKITLPLVLQQVSHDHAKAIAEHMMEKGVSWDAHMEISIGDQRIPGSNVIDLLTALTSKKFTRLDIPGMSDVVKLFPQFGEPFNLFSRKVQDKYRGRAAPATPETNPSPTATAGGRKKRQ